MAAINNYALKTSFKHKTKTTCSKNAIKNKQGRNI